jgi:hypothetical protein
MADFEDMYVSNVSLLTDDRRIFHRADCTYEEVAEVLEGTFSGNVLTCVLKLGASETMKLSVQAVARRARL